MQYSFEALLDGVADQGTDAGISLWAQLEPLGGRGAPVKPAVYAGGTYQRDRRWWGNRDEPVEAVVVDNVPSEANRMEQALRDLAEELGLPVIELDLSSVGDLPPHVAHSLTSFDLPHRHADAYLRDSDLTDGGEGFRKSEVGAAMEIATPRNPEALLQWSPQSLLYGFWQSHLGKKGAQTKFARAVESEIVGYLPASTDTRRLGVKGDPLNLSIDDKVAFDPDDHTTWELLDGTTKAGGKSKDSLSEIGHGQVPFSTDAALGPISFSSIEQQATISFPRLRHVALNDPAQNAAARALLAALGVVGVESAFGRAFTLRSGCDLRPAERRYTWLGGQGDEQLDGVSLDTAVSVFNEAAEHAAGLGIPVGSAWESEPLKLVPNKQLAAVIRKTFGLESE